MSSSVATTSALEVAPVSCVGASVGSIGNEDSVILWIATWSKSVASPFKSLSMY